MKTMRMLAALAVGVVVLAAAPQAGRLGVNSAGAADCAVTLPPVQWFSEWRGTPFVGDKVANVTVLVYRSPKSEERVRRFRAFGVDATTGAILFQVDGDSRELPRFNAVLNDELVGLMSAAEANGLSFTWSINIDINKPIPPTPPTPGGDEAVAWGVRSAAATARAAMGGL